MKRNTTTQAVVEIPIPQIAKISKAIKREKQKYFRSGATKIELEAERQQQEGNQIYKMLKVLLPTN